jgi:hypothetical protein
MQSSKIFTIMFLALGLSVGIASAHDGPCHFEGHPHLWCHTSDDDPSYTMVTIPTTATVPARNPSDAKGHMLTISQACPDGGYAMSGSVGSNVISTGAMYPSHFITLDITPTFGSGGAEDGPPTGYSATFINNTWHAVEATLYLTCAVDTSEVDPY